MPHAPQSTFASSNPTARPSSRKKRSKARSAPPPPELDLAQHDDYEPRAGQVKRKGTKRSRAQADEGGVREEEQRRRKRVKKDRKGKGKAENQDEQEGEEQAPVKKAKKVPAKKEAAKATKGKEKKQPKKILKKPGQASQPGQRKKKTVRIDAPPNEKEQDDGGDSDNSSVMVVREGAAGEEEENDEDADGDNDDLEILSFAALDYADPAFIPPNPGRKSQKYWRSIEYGVYRTALHDVARDRAELGRVLVEWEMLRRRRAAEEKEDEEREEAAREAEEGEEGAQQRADDEDRPPSPAPLDDPSEDDEQASDDDLPPPNQLQQTQTMKKKPPAPKAKLKPKKAGVEGVGNSVLKALAHLRHDPYRNLTPFPLPRDPDEAAKILTIDPEDGTQLLPLPSSMALAKMARWPVHPEVYEEGAAPSAKGFEEVLRDVAEEARVRDPKKKLVEEPPREKRKRVRSAYGPGGPLEGWGSPPRPSSAMSSSSSASSASDFEDSASNVDCDLDLPPSTFSPSFTPPVDTSSIPPLISTLLLRLLDFVPKSTFPAPDYSRAKKAADLNRALDLVHRTGRDENAPGWEEVLALARESEGVPDRVVDKLEDQLVAIYGPPTRGEITLPPVGGKPFLPSKLLDKKKPKRDRKGAEGKKAGRKKRRRKGEDELSATGLVKRIAELRMEAEKGRTKGEKRVRERGRAGLRGKAKGKVDDKGKGREKEQEGMEEGEGEAKEKVAEKDKGQEAEAADELLAQSEVNEAEEGATPVKGKKRRKTLTKKFPRKPLTPAVVEDDDLADDTLSASPTSSHQLSHSLWDAQPLPLPSGASTSSAAQPQPAWPSLDPSFGRLDLVGSDDGTGGGEGTELPVPPPEFWNQGGTEASTSGART
ncbi:hypothetical protein JCM8547_000342 [Rhodosporidiobolus lusitaniae]